MVAQPPESMFRLMVDSLRDGAFLMVDPEGRILSWNAGAEEITGYRPEEMLDTSAARLYAPAEAAAGAPAADLRMATERGRLVTTGWRLRRDGTRFWAETVLAALRNPQERLLGFSVLIRDLSERDPRTEESLKRTGERMRQFIEHTPAAVAMLDREMRYIQASRRWIGDYRLSGREVIGRSHYELFPDLPDRVKEMHRRCLAGASERGEDDVAGPDGSREWIRWEAQPWRDSTGDIGGLIILSEVITERKRSEERFRLAVEAAPTALITINAAGGIVLANAQAAKLFGYEPGELEGRPADLLVPEPFRGKAFKDSQYSPLGSGRELWGLTKAGGEIPIEVGLHPIETTQGALVLAAVVDVSERKKFEGRMEEINKDLEGRLQERAALAETGAAKLREMASLLTLVEQRERQRLAQILHDHLQQLLVAARLDLGRLHRPNDEAAARAIVVNVERLVDESLNVSRDLTADLVPPFLHEGGLVSALEWLAKRMKEKEGLDVRIESQVGDVKLSEERRLLVYQVVRALLLNVVNHAETKEACVRVSAEGHIVRIVVDDQGKGFDPESIGLASRGSADSSLLRARDRLEILGGRLEIASRAGGGTVVTLEAPLDEGVTSPSRPALRIDVRPDTGGKPAPEPGGERIRVLVADDHIILRQGLVKALKDYPDIEVVAEAGDGREAVAKALAYHPNIVIMDITMPVMNGIEATRKIKEAKPSIKVIGLSIQEAEELAPTMIHMGANSYVSKSGPVDELVKAIRRTSRAVPAIPVRE